MRGYLIIMFHDWIRYNSIDDVSTFAALAANALNRSQDEILECIDGEIAHEKANSINRSTNDDSGNG
jgi:CRISPR/Cas system-associated endonuclease Cas3-HD